MPWLIVGVLCVYIRIRVYIMYMCHVQIACIHTIYRCIVIIIIYNTGINVYIGIYCMWPIVAVVVVVVLPFSFISDPKWNAIFSFVTAAAALLIYVTFLLLLHIQSMWIICVYAACSFGIYICYLGLLLGEHEIHHWIAPHDICLWYFLNYKNIYITYVYRFSSSNESMNSDIRFLNK